jgi:MFS family permease
VKQRKCVADDGKHRRIGTQSQRPSRKLRAPGAYGWVIVAVSTVCLALGFGAASTVSVFMKPFEQEFGWFRADVSMAYTMQTIGAALGGLVWGSLSDRIGVTKIAFIGAVAMSAGLAALRWQGDLWLLYLLYFLIGAIGFACLFTPVLALTGLWFNERKGFAIGIVTAGGAIGQGVVPYVAQLLITEFGWRGAALYLVSDIPFFYVRCCSCCGLRRPLDSRTIGPIDWIPTFGVCRMPSPSRGSASRDCSAASAWRFRSCISCRSALISDAARRRRRDCCCR